MRDARAGEHDRRESRSLGVTALVVSLSLSAGGCGDGARPPPRTTGYDLLGNYLLSYEVIPWPGSLPPECDLGRLSYERQEVLTREVKNRIGPRLEEVLGLAIGALETQVRPGGFERITTPSLQTNVSGLAMSPDRVARVAASLGFVLRQYSVLVSDGTVARWSPSCGVRPEAVERR